jgi:hypothetical protein
MSTPTSASLRIRKFDSDLSFEVWPHATVPSGLITEGGTYAIEAFGAIEQSANLSIDGIDLEALRPKGDAVALWRWNLGFYAGRVRFVLRESRRTTATFTLIADPHIAKLTTSEFEQMVFDILEDTQALFSLSTVRVSLGEGEDRLPPPIARLELIKSRVDRLSEVIRLIDARPQRALDVSAEDRRISDVRSLEPLDYQRALQRGRAKKTPSGRWLPFTVDIQESVITTDTPENRFVKQYLKQVAAWLGQASDLLSLVFTGDAERDKVATRWAGICTALAKKLRALEDLPTFRETRPFSSLKGPTSPAFSRIPAYIEFRKLYTELRKCFANVTGSFLDVPLARTFELYELWAFLRLARATKARFGLSDEQCRSVLANSGESSRASALKREVVLPTPEAALCFQRVYNEYWLEANGIGSFSRTMIPDISFERLAGAAPKAVLFDAKYRVGRDLNEALTSLHTYRDAVIHSQPHVGRLVAGAYILTPESLGSEKPWTDLKSPAVLFHPDYRGEFKFGAITMKPGISLAECEAILDLAFGDAGIGKSVST